MTISIGNASVTMTAAAPGAALTAVAAPRDIVIRDANLIRLGRLPLVSLAADIADRRSQSRVSPPFPGSISSMADLVLLTDAEITAVAGGAVTQTVSFAVTQHSTATVTSSGSATNAGNVTATVADSRIRAAMMRANRAHIVAVPQIHVFTALNTIHCG
jgi:hypothetical protein